MDQIFRLVLTAVAFLVIFSVLVIIHECGHFFMARKSGIKVEEFGFGIPPRIWGFKKGETLYSLNAIPFGGFVRLFGEDSRDSKILKNPRSFAHKPICTRIMVILAGVVMNFLLAWVLLTVGFSFGIQPLIVSSEDFVSGVQSGVIEIRPGVIIKEVRKGSAAQLAGLQPNDNILAVNGKEFFSLDQFE